MGVLTPVFLLNNGDELPTGSVFFTLVEVLRVCLESTFAKEVVMAFETAALGLVSERTEARGEEQNWTS